MAYYDQIGSSKFLTGSFTTAFVSMGCTILLCLLISTLRIKPQRIFRHSKAKKTSIKDRLLSLRFIIFFISGVLLQISFGPYYGFFALFLRDLSYTGMTVGLLISLGVIAEILVFIFSNIFFQRFSLKLLLVFSLLVTGARWFLVALYADSIFLLMFTQILHAASFALYHSASMLFISQHFTSCQQSRGQGLYLGGVYGVGGAIGAYIAGVLWLNGEGADTAFLTASAFATLAGFLMLFLPQPIKKPNL